MTFHITAWQLLEFTVFLATALAIVGYFTAKKKH
jgi:hypothetical protein